MKNILLVLFSLLIGQISFADVSINIDGYEGESSVVLNLDSSESVDLSLTVQAQSGDDIDVSRIRPYGAGVSGDFSSCQKNYSDTNGLTCSTTISVDSSAVGTKRISMTSSQGTYRITLQIVRNTTGEVLSPEDFQTALTIVGGEPYDFGTVSGANERIIRTLYLKNNGTAKTGVLNNFSISENSPFIITGNACQGSDLLPGRTCRLSIEFGSRNGYTDNTYQANLQVGSSEQNSSASLALEGIITGYPRVLKSNLELGISKNLSPSDCLNDSSILDKSKCYYEADAPTVGLSSVSSVSCNPETKNCFVQAQYQPPGEPVSFDIVINFKDEQAPNESLADLENSSFEISPETVDLGSVSAGVIKNQILTLTNTGTTNLSLPIIFSVKSAQGASFSLVDNCLKRNAPLEPGQSCTAELQIVPRVAQTVQMEIQATSIIGSKTSVITGTIFSNKVLTIVKSGAGQGEISDDSGVICDENCSFTTKTYPSNTVVNLTATGVGNNEFLQWGQSCSGSTSCQITMGSNKTIIASFGIPITPPHQNLGIIQNRSFLSQGNITAVAEANNKLYFRGTEGLYGIEAWSLDLSSLALKRLTDLSPGTLSSAVDEFTALGTEVLFSGYDEVSVGTALWKVDENDNVYLLKDFYPGNSSSSLTYFKEFNNKIYFTANSPTEGFEMGVSDGTVGGTGFIGDVLKPGTAGASPRNYTVFNNELYFVADNPFGVSSDQLMKMDVNENFTALTNFSDTNYTLTYDSLFYLPTDEMPIVGNNLFMRIWSNNINQEFYLYNLSSSIPTTSGILDLVPGNQSSIRGNIDLAIDKVSGDAYFGAFLDGYGGELIRLTTGGAASLTEDLNSGTAYSSPQDMTALPSGGVLFRAQDDALGIGLYRVDGSTISLVKDMDPSGTGGEVLSIVPAGDRVLFVGNDNVNGRELWTSDGTPGGTYMVKEINTDSSLLGGNGFSVLDDNFIPVQISATEYLFAARTQGNVYEFWVTDFTSQGTYRSPHQINNRMDVYRYAVGANGKGFYTMPHKFSIGYKELLVLDSENQLINEPTITQVPGSSSVHNYKSFNGKTYFIARQESLADYDLYEYLSNGTINRLTNTSSNESVKGQMEVFNNKLYYFTGGSSSNSGYKLNSLDSSGNISQVEDNSSGKLWKGENVVEMPDYGLFKVANNSLFYLIQESTGGGGGGSSDPYETFDACVNAGGDFNVCDYCSFGNPADPGCQDYLSQLGVGSGFDYQACEQQFPSFYCDDCVQGYGDPQICDQFSGGSSSLVLKKVDQSGQVSTVATIESFGGDQQSFSILGVVGTNLMVSTDDSIHVIDTVAGTSSTVSTSGIIPETYLGSSEEYNSTIGTGARSTMIVNRATTVGTNIYFLCSSSVGREVCEFNGLTNAFAVIDVRAGSSTSFPNSLVSFNNKLYFQANDGTEEEIFSYNPLTSSLTKIDVDNDPTQSSVPRNLVVGPGGLYFIATLNGEREILRMKTDESIETFLDVSGPGENTHANGLILDPDTNTLFFFGVDSLGNPRGYSQSIANE